MKRLSENGARPVATLGGLTAPPCFRLGALVFQPNNTEPLYWASLWAPTRIAGCALGDRPMDTRWENVSPERRSASWFTPSGPTKPKAPPVPSEPTDNSTISFSLWTVFAEHTEKLPAAASTPAGSGCIRNPHSQTNKNNDIKTNPQGLTTILIAGSH
jgi:hypothetical protein